MHFLLSKLGVPEELQAFFNADQLCFNYGIDQESFSLDFHFLPTTRNLWCAGHATASELIITSSAMEAISYLTLNIHRHPVIPLLLFIAVGNVPNHHQLQWLITTRRNRKITLVFGSDIIGRVSDITIAMGICKKAVRTKWNNGKISMLANGVIFDADPEVLTLNLFEKVSGIRTAIRTRKPLRHNSFLEQLKHEAKLQ